MQVMQAVQGYEAPRPLFLSVQDSLGFGNIEKRGIINKKENKNDLSMWKADETRLIFEALKKRNPG